MKEVQFSVLMNVKTMYRFQMRNGYSGIYGVINFLLSGGAIALLIAGVAQDSTAKVALVVVALLFTVINPINLLYRSAKQVKLTPMFQKPLEYCVSENDITISQDDNAEHLEWKYVCKVVETSKDVYLYFSLTRAFIFPKEAIGTQLDDLKALIKACTNPATCKYKGKF